MHNVRKKRTTEEQAARKKEVEKHKIQEYRKLVDQYLTSRKNGAYDDEALKLTTTLLNWNPETYSVWNYRREILKKQFEGMDESSVQETLNKELEFTFERMKAFPKTYWIWNHRRWCLDTGSSPNWDIELGLVSKMLEFDPRNFHGWHYRRYVIANIEAAKGKSYTQEELEYTKKKINANFSNFSAWHNRTKLIPRYLKETGDDPKKFLKEELEYVRNAFYTDPDDQSSWIYHRWLVLSGEIAQLSEEEKTEMLKREIESISELYEVEPDNKWCLFFLALYQRELGATDGVNEKLEKLKSIDPLRKSLYDSMMK
ncbi:geranylgeranyl transferase type-2 subunit alpha [Trichomonascus vanleenenianus]|uniref:Rab geranylgeranyltransferase BET4 n=1 Tax=Trichomonascus vanleenenianus TaxID=2268995 RepID=UPI003ECB18AD